MRLVLRNIIIAYGALQATTRLVGGFDYGSNHQQTTILLVLALLMLNIFMIPLFRILSLPHYGIGFMFLNFVLTLVVIYVLTYFLSGFSIIETTLPELNILGFVLPSKSLTVFWSATYSALTISVVYHFIEWLFEKR